MDIRLIVIRTANPAALAAFYSLFGVTFDYHQHGNSPFHYGGNIGPTLLEIYPLTKNQTESDKYLRLGFGINNFDDTIVRLKAEQVTFDSEPAKTEFGFMAVIVDPDGRKIELYKNILR